MNYELSKLPRVDGSFVYIVNELKPSEIAGFTYEAKEIFRGTKEECKDKIKELINLHINTLEMQMEYFDTIECVQNTIHEVSVMLKNNKNKDLQQRFDNLIKHFRKVYLNEE